MTRGQGLSKKECPELRQTLKVKGYIILGTGLWRYAEMPGRLEPQRSVYILF